MLGRSDRLEPNEWDLHGTQESHNEKSIVCDINAMGDSVHQDKCENVKRDKVDDKNISSPCGYHVKVGKCCECCPVNGSCFNGFDPQVVGEHKGENCDAFIVIGSSNRS